MDKTDIATRMKGYEFIETLDKLMPMIPTCVRLDGRSFSKFTKGLGRPFDARMSTIMINVTKALVSEFNALVGYTQSDEISLIFLHDTFEQMMFGAKKFKMISSLTSKCTVEFYKGVLKMLPEKAHLAPTFDCRVFQVPTCTEAVNYLIWRELDASKNSVSMLAQSHFSHKELHEKCCNQMQDMLHNIGINWNNYPSFFKRGTYVKRVVHNKKLTSAETDDLPQKHQARFNTDFNVKRTSIDEIKDMWIMKLNSLDRENFVFKKEM